MYVLDVEGDSLTPTKFHCLSYSDGVNTTTLTTHEDMAKWLVQPNLVLVFHNGVLWDVPQLERVLKIKIDAQIIDTLAISWYLWPMKKKHGLEQWGGELGIAKPKIEDWVNLKLEDYVHRCETDVAITLALWKKQRAYLSAIYNSHAVEKLPILKYLTFKLECARLAEESKVEIDLDLVEATYQTLLAEKEDKENILKAVMPGKGIWIVRPAKPFKKDGSVSVAGEKWFKFISDQGLTKDHVDPIYVINQDANPSSPDQVKDWLFSLGWKPIRYETAKVSGNEVPQIKKAKDGPELCPSVLELADDEPAILQLEGLSIINHRLGILKSFKENVDATGCVKAKVAGFTNTLRFKHAKPLVNLPGVEKPYGKEIRGCLKARNKFELVGSDMVSLEDTTKKHFMFFHDPKYVEEMSVEGFDPHLDLAVAAKAIDKDDYNFYTGIKKDKREGGLSDNELAAFKSIGIIRQVYKIVNYSSVYGVGAPKLAREAKISVPEARKLLDAYWKRNWSVRKLSEELVVKEVNGQKWLFNPVSKFYYSLRAEKDRFSTLNQGTGVFAFDSWIREVITVRPQLSFQMHDEILLEVKKGNREKADNLLYSAIEAVNNKLKLNVTLKVDVKYGDTYANVH